MKITTKEMRELTTVIDDIIEQYKIHTPTKARNWAVYEQDYQRRLQVACQQLSPLIEEAIDILNIQCGESRGVKRKLTLHQEVSILLIQRLIQVANRPMAIIASLFSMLTNMPVVSYKTIERIYSREDVAMVLHNMHLLMLQHKGIREADTCGDATGYMLTVKENYESISQKLKDEKAAKKSKCVFAFALMDIHTRLYVAYGSSFHSEKQAFEAAMTMAANLEINIKSIRLDRYYSCQMYVELINRLWDDAEIVVIPKKNSTIKGSWAWKRSMHNFVTDPVGYLSDYFKRNLSESGFSEDKKRTGWQISQKLPDRVDMAIATINTWHNLCWLGIT